MHPMVSVLLGALQYAPQAISEVTALYNAVKGGFSPADTATIDAALAKAQQDDAAATVAANAL